MLVPHCVHITFENPKDGKSWIAMQQPVKGTEKTSALGLILPLTYGMTLDIHSLIHSCIHSCI